MTSSAGRRIGLALGGGGGRGLSHLHVTLLDFFKSGAALKVSEPARDETRRALERLLA